MNSSERFNLLLALYLEGTISRSQHDEFFEMMETGNFDKQIESAISKSSEATIQFHDDMDEVTAEAMFQTIVATGNAGNQSHNSPGKWKENKLVATVLTIVFFICFFLIVNYFSKSNHLSSERFELDFTKTHHDKFVNNTDSLRSIKLPDGSTVKVEPQSTLRYDKKRFSTQREVYMTGNGASFQVVKKPLSPFHIFFGNLQATVLGTTFIFHTDKVSGKPELTVTAGKVKLAENKRIEGTSAEKEPVLITPNHKSIYDPLKHDFKNSLCDKPLQIKSDEYFLPVAGRDISWNFRDVSLSLLSKQLRDTYGIDIILKNKELENCLFSGNLGGEDYYTKLKTMCVALNTTYEITGDKIVINGPGCINH